MTDLVDELTIHGSAATLSPRRRAIPAARAERRRQLQAAANNVLVLRGYHAACMDEIAGLAGVSKPVVYQHFSGKLELYSAVLHMHADSLISEVLRALRSTTDNHQRVRAVVQAYFDFVDDEAEGFRLVFESDVVGEPSVKRIVDRACVDAISDFVARDSMLDTYRARALAIGLVGASEITARYWLECARPGPKCEAVEATVALCWGGLSSIPLYVDRPR
jgi:AcrR family transcriptional regulator